MVLHCHQTLVSFCLDSQRSGHSVDMWLSFLHSCLSHDSAKGRVEGARGVGFSCIWVVGFQRVASVAKVDLTVVSR